MFKKECFCGNVETVELDAEMIEELENNNFIEIICSDCGCDFEIYLEDIENQEEDDYEDDYEDDEDED